MPAAKSKAKKVGTSAVTAKTSKEAPSKRKPADGKMSDKPTKKRTATSSVTKNKPVAAAKVGTASSKAKSKDRTPSVETALLEPAQEAPAGRGFMGIPPYQIVPGEAYMNERQKTHFEHILLTWRRALVAELSRTVSEMKDSVINFPDLNDRASLEEGFSLELQARNRERKLVSKIDEVLEHIGDDDYGYCETCGIEIGIRRLEARPTATQCIDCKTLDEIKERQTRG